MLLPYTEESRRSAVVWGDDGREWHRRRATPGQRNKSLVVVLVIGVVLLAVAILLYFVTRWHLQRKRREALPTSPTQAKAPSKFSRFRLPPPRFPTSWSRGRSTRGEYSDQLQEDPSTVSLANNGQAGGNEHDTDVVVTNLNRDGSQSSHVNRNTSVRSIMTLPPYTPSVRDTEQVIAREGERGGMDTVVEFPETVDDEEQRREEEMESLYQIRRTRRQENTDREERRRLRREARERGDLAALEELRESTRAASEAVHTNPEHSAALIAAHQTVNRDRRVSSVQYGNIGVVQHDGSRLRSHSTESERPLLEGAAGMDGQERSVSRSTLTTHHRGRSASSVMSVSTNASDDGFHTAAASPALSLSQPSRNGNGESEFEMVAVGGRGSWPSPMARARSNTGTTAEGTGGDVADQRIPELDPPMYEEAFEAVPLEDAPPYESPVRVGAPQLPMLEQLPSITVTESHSPVTPPMGGDERRF